MFKYFNKYLYRFLNFIFQIKQSDFIKSFHMPDFVDLDILRNPQMAVTPEEVCQMEQWYVLKTVPGREQEGADLIKRAVTPGLFKECRVLRKIKVFRSGGALRFLEGVLFPGYVFVRTACPGALDKELKCSRDFPQFPSITPVEAADLAFLEDICGRDLERPMGVTRLTLGGDNRIIRADGILSGYVNRIIKLNLHKRFALAQVELFGRVQPVLFGVTLEQDPLMPGGYGGVCSGRPAV